MKKKSHHQAGLSIVTAIFLLVVLSGLAAAIVSVSTTQHASSAIDLLGSRAYEAARSGAEYGLYQSARANNMVACNKSFQLTAPTLSSFTVTVQCSAAQTANMPAGVAGTPTEGQPLGYPIVTTITATACNIPAGTTCPNTATTSADYVQRVVTVQY